MSTPEAFPPLREVIAHHGLAARKRLGQHFLLDLNVTRKIARLAGPLEGRTVVEIGPGPGGLTRALLEQNPRRLIAVERDARCIAALGALRDAADGRLEILESDALTLDEARALDPDAPDPHERAVIVANLPYNISTALLAKWLTARPRWWGSMTLMFQKEVAERIIAEPGSKTYGRLSVLAQLAATPEKLMDLPARAFTPPPKVASAVVRFEACEIDLALLPHLERATAAAFAQRRKMLRSSLKPVMGEMLKTDADFQALGLAPSWRAEDVSPAAYLELAKRIADLNDRD